MGDEEWGNCPNCGKSAHESELGFVGLLVCCKHCHENEERKLKMAKRYAVAVCRNSEWTLHGDPSGEELEPAMVRLTDCVKSYGEVNTRLYQLVGIAYTDGESIVCDECLGDADDSHCLSCGAESDILDGGQCPMCFEMYGYSGHQ